MIRAAVGIKAWIAKLPGVDEVRPTQCVGCGTASRPVGQRLAVHGHGLLERQLRGVLEIGGAPGVFVLSVRRYACLACKAVMTVVPAGMLARRLYSAPSIALALHRCTCGCWSGFPTAWCATRSARGACTAAAEAVGRSCIAGLGSLRACSRCRDPQLLERELGARVSSANLYLKLTREAVPHVERAKAFLQALRREDRPNHADALLFAEGAIRGQVSKFEPCVPKELLLELWARTAIDLEGARSVVAGDVEIAPGCRK